MARARPQFVCANCGAVSSRWQGRCESCGEWNTIAEEAPAAVPVALRTGRGSPVALTALAGETKEEPRALSGVGEFDRVIGGGFVPGSAILVGGDPGIGKSTILIQVAAAMARAGRRVVYVSGEEAIGQIRLRAERLGLRDAPVALASETRVEDILATLAAGPPVDLVIIDSIQTLWTDIVESAPGTVTQVRTSAQAMIRYAKASNASVVLVGHVTKDGQIAGPRVVEHMVDAVLYFEGETGHHFRLLRAVKNRFGPASEIGVFEMTDAGLKEVANPSLLFIGDRDTKSPGDSHFRRHRGHASAARGGAGTRRGEPAWNRPPRRGRLGPEPTRHAACGARNPLRHAFRQPRCLSERRGGPETRRAGRRSGRCRRPDLLAGRSCDAARECLFRRGEPFRGGQARDADHDAAE